MLDTFVPFFPFLLDVSRPRRLASAERFNPSSGVWEALPPMNERRDRAAVATIADRLYAPWLMALEIS